MKNFVNVICGLSFFLSLLLLMCLIFGWLFHLNYDNIQLCLRYTTFTFLVSWFINLLFFKK